MVWKQGSNDALESGKKTESNNVPEIEYVESGNHLDPEGDEGGGV